MVRLQWIDITLGKVYKKLSHNSTFVKNYTFEEKKRKKEKKEEEENSLATYWRACVLRPPEMNSPYSIYFRSQV